MATMTANEEPLAVSVLEKFSLIYLATPYSKYPDGLTAAFEVAARFTADLLRAGLKVYSPITHTHPIAIYGNIDPLDHLIWLPFDEVIMEKSDALLVAKIPGWTTSFGIGKEIKWFRERKKPIYYIDPESLEVTK